MLPFDDTAELEEVADAVVGGRVGDRVGGDGGDGQRGDSGHLLL